MRQILFFIAAVLAFCACSSDEPQPADREVYEATQWLNEEYGQDVIGSWQNDSALDETFRVITSMEANADHSFTRSISYATRERIDNNGTTEYTEWTVEPQRSENGIWQLRARRDDDGTIGSYMTLGIGDKYNTVIQDVGFLSADDTTMYICPVLWTPMKFVRQ